MKQLSESAHWLGVTDWTTQYFHGYGLSTHRGTSYNSYLIKDEKIAVVDGVMASFADQWLENLEQLVDFSKIDYVISNHSETDHSGSLLALMEKAPQAKVIVTQKGKEHVQKQCHKDWNFQVVKTGDKISLGSKEVIFVEAKMLHWPDSMMTYLTGDNILFSNDAFGQHYATSSIFNDEAEMDEVYQEAIKYFTNILTPFRPMLLKKIEELKKLNLPIQMIAPSHGIIWRDNPMQVVEKYVEWASDYAEPRVTLLYDSMWDNTEIMTKAIAKGLHAAGVDYKMHHMVTADKNDIMTDIFRSKGVLLGSPTINNRYLPTTSPVLEEIRCLRFTNKMAATFGSYGWTGESPKLLAAHLEESKFEIVQEPLKVKFTPTEEELEQCFQFGKSFGEKVLSKFE
ncbi:flavorubredoxin [Desulfitispora alkaliphila]|uniref:flavodoxin domain-containing protein n=1 Tax=Desulfitispora alkaliphila TaxID=622674 RepID=UPI003D1BD308